MGVEEKSCDAKGDIDVKTRCEDDDGSDDAPAAILGELCGRNDVTVAFDDSRCRPCCSLLGPWVVVIIILSVEWAAAANTC